MTPPAVRRIDDRLELGADNTVYLDGHPVRGRVSYPIGRAIVEVRRPDGSLRGRATPPWEAFRNDFKDLISLSILEQITADNKSQLTINDIGGIAETLSVIDSPAQSLSDRRTFNDSDVGLEITLRWGTDGTAADGSRDSLISEQDSFGISDETKDVANNLYRVSGSAVWTGAATTLREVGYDRQMLTPTATSPRFLLDRTVVADEPVATDDTVAVTYEWTW